MKKHQLFYKLASDSLSYPTINFIEFFRLRGQMTSTGFYCDRKENASSNSYIYTFYTVKDKLINQLTEVYVDDSDSILLRYYNCSQKDLEAFSAYISKSLQRNISINICQLA